MQATSHLYQRFSSLDLWQQMLSHLSQAFHVGLSIVVVLNPLGLSNLFTGIALRLLKNTGIYITLHYITFTVAKSQL